MRGRGDLPSTPPRSRLHAEFKPPVSPVRCACKSSRHVRGASGCKNRAVPKLPSWDPPVRVLLLREGSEPGLRLPVHEWQPQRPVASARWARKGAERDTRSANAVLPLRSKRGEADWHVALREGAQEEKSADDRGENIRILPVSARLRSGQRRQDKVFFAPLRRSKPRSLPRSVGARPERLGANIPIVVVRSSVRPLLLPRRAALRFVANARPRNRTGSHCKQRLPSRSHSSKLA